MTPTKVTPTTSAMWLARAKKDMEHAPDVRALAAIKDNVKPRLTKADTERLRVFGPRACRFLQSRSAFDF